MSEIMTERELERRIHNEREQIQLLTDEYAWRMGLLREYRSALLRIEKLVIFCNTGAYPE